MIGEQAVDGRVIVGQQLDTIALRHRQRPEVGGERGDLVLGRHRSGLVASFSATSRMKGASRWKRSVRQAGKGGRPIAA